MDTCCVRRRGGTIYGFTVGGPVWIPKVYNGRNKTFFFFNWEQYRLTQNVLPAAISVPTDAYRQGNFTAALLSTRLGTDPLGRAITPNMIYDPTTRQTVAGQVVTNPFPNNTVPPTRFDNVAKKVQALIPNPTNPALLVNNYQQTYLSHRTTEVPSIKIDQSLGSKDKLSAFWNQYRNHLPVLRRRTGLAPTHRRRHRHVYPRA